MFNTEGLSAHADKALAGLRIIAGLMFMQHGLMKWIAFPAAMPMEIEPFSQLGIGGLIEIVGGALIALGLFTRPTAFICSGMMAVAYFQMHWNFGKASFYPAVNGGELAVMYCWVFLYLVFAGAGAWSIDRMLSNSRRRF